MKNETFTPERIKAEADAFFEWDGEDRSLVTTTSCLLFAQHIAGLIQDRAAQPAPVVPEGWSARLIKDGDAAGYVVSTPQDEAGVRSNTSVWADDDDPAHAMLWHMLAAAPAQGQQVECQELRAALLKVSRDADKLRAELAALKAQQVGQESEPAPKQHPDDAAVDRFAAAMKAKLARSREKGRHGWQNCTAPHLSAMLYDHLYKADPLDVGNFAMMLHQNGQAIELPFEARGRHTTPQPAPAQDVAGWIPVAERLPNCGQAVLAYYLNRQGMGRRIRAEYVTRWTVEAEMFADPDTECVEYSEQDDTYYVTEGWYELIDNWDEYARIAVNEGVVTRWMPLPAAPSSDKQSGENK